MRNVYFPISLDLLLAYFCSGTTWVLHLGNFFGCVDSHTHLDTRRIHNVVTSEFTTSSQNDLTTVSLRTHCGMSVN